LSAALVWDSSRLRRAMDAMTSLTWGGCVWGGGWVGGWVGGWGAGGGGRVGVGSVLQQGQGGRRREGGRGMSGACSTGR
jgi:hypothetical protein